MKKLILISFSIVSTVVVAQTNVLEPKTNPKTTMSKGAGCAPPSTTTMMELNNVRYMAHTAGNMWQVPTKNLSQYEVPKNSGIMALFTSALWLGGTDANNQLKLAALRYRNGQDYWTGPLSNITAEVNSETCTKYDRHFITSQDEIRQFVAWYNAGLEDQQNGGNSQSTLFPNYKIPKIIEEWPAHGDVSLGQDFYLAPFFDNNEDGVYNWLDGDYPFHDIYKTRDCTSDRKVYLYGDLNYWWVMNDKGNIHTETNAEPIGMEIRAQTFCFASNDEINNMSFYNYELINRGSLTLFNTYFGFFTDGALGNPFDDYVGCDVSRGLGYYYNGTNIDLPNAGFLGYGASPPAVGVDFFEGPYQDNDGIDNAFGIGPNEALNGIGYGDGIIDNERFGMRRFLYYSNNTQGADPSQTDPINASDYYNYMRGFWKDNSPFYYGGSGHFSDPEANLLVECEFMFPGDSDPLGWGTGGIPQPVWTEQTANNPPNDRRFVQSAGPFVLRPGAINNITVGVVWARALAGDPFASVEVLKRADDKAQSLFENCFRIIDAPHAPNLEIQELENELILTLYNTPSSNNYREQYVEFDPFIVTDDSTADRNYRFQGYQIFQLRDNSVAANDLDNPNLARLAAQCDLKDNISRIINFDFDEQLQASIPVEKVNGENKGIRHSFRVTEDLFAQGDRKLVNHKRYYFMAVAYAFNQYKPYNPNDPNLLDGQKKAYLQSRKTAIGDIRPVEGIPHLPLPELGGTYQLAEYGAQPKIKRLDGHGNGGMALELTEESKNTIIQNGYLSEVEYNNSGGPIMVKVIDPLNVADGYFELLFNNYSGNFADTALWTLNRYSSEGGELLGSISSEVPISQNNEQLIPQWGVSVQINQQKYYQENGLNGLTDITTDILSSSLRFEDSSKVWLQPISDQDINNPLNWIRSGIPAPTGTAYNPALNYNDPNCYTIELALDPSKKWSRILSGGMAPHRLVGYQCDFMPLAYYKTSYNYPNGPESSPGAARTAMAIAYSPSVDIVITPDPTLWTRCPVIELGRDPALNVGGAKPGAMRNSPSVGKNGQPDGSGTGMGWFPGYAIDLESGARLYMAFGENSFLANAKGADMIWNPTARLFDAVGNPILGGLQPIYVFSYKNQTLNGNSQLYDLGSYSPQINDANHELKNLLEAFTGSVVNPSVARQFYSSLSWVGYLRGVEYQNTLATTANISVRLSKSYRQYTASGKNQGKPMYSWNMAELATKLGERNALAEVLEHINIVPNPYYAFSAYERNRLDTRVKITNLPDQCEIRIYSVNGKLVRSFKKDSPITSLDWDLNNFKGIPVASGVYLVHVTVPEVGERVLKFYAGVRQADFQNL